MNIYEVLHRDHVKIKCLFEEIIRRINRNDWDEVRDLYFSLKSELIIHAKAEEETFHNLLIADDCDNTLTWEAKEDHHTIALVIYQLHRLRMNDQEWTEKFKHLYKVEAIHIEKEEQNLFSLAKTKFSYQRAEEAGIQMLALKDQMRINSEKLLEKEQHIITIVIIKKGD